MILNSVGVTSPHGFIMNASWEAGKSAWYLKDYIKRKYSPGGLDGLISQQDNMLVYLERILISIFHYEKKYEKGRFFDTWWQFYHTISYLLVIVIVILIHFTINLFELKYNPIQSAAPFIIIFVLELFTSELRGTALEEYVLKKESEIKPINIWLLVLLGIGLIFLLILSFAWVV